jgi:hypothetical protein
MSVKLTSEICINKASSNSRLTAAGRWAIASDSHSQNCLQTLSFFSLPLMRQQLNYTCMLKNLLKLYCIWTWDTLWCFFCFFFFWFGFFGIFPFWWDNDRTTSETPSPELEAEGRTPKLLRLKLYCIWTWIFFSQSSLCLSNVCSTYCWLVHYLSLFIALKLFCLFYFFNLFVYLFFPLSLTSLLPISSHPFILNITIVIITS